MKLIINGKAVEVPDVRTVRELVVHLGFGERPVAVEVNKTLVPKRRHEEAGLAEGDVVEVVTLVGGG